MDRWNTLQHIVWNSKRIHQNWHDWVRDFWSRKCLNVFRRKSTKHCSQIDLFGFIRHMKIQLQECWIVLDSLRYFSLPLIKFQDDNYNFFKTIFQLHIPPYASSLHFDLYEEDDKNHYIQIFYRKSEEEKLSPMDIPNCGKKCTMDRLNTLYKDIIPGDFESECRI